MICAVMPFESANPIPPPIRGVLRTELIRDLALGEQTYELLASKYGRSHQAVKQFAARNADEIRRAKQALVADPKDEYAGVAIAKKWYRVADADQDLAPHRGAVAGPESDRYSAEGLPQFEVEASS